MTDVEMMRREIASVRMENSQLRGELSAVSNQGPGNHNSVPSMASYSSKDPARPELPPLRSLSGEISTAPESMAGVQYEQPRMSAYRVSDGRY